TTEKADIEYLIQEVPKAVDQTMDGVNQVAKIVRSMRKFSHPGQEKKTIIDINEAIESTITVARNEWKYVSDVVTNFDPSLPSIPCLPGELNQVFLNMITNAAHSIGDVIGDGSNGKGTIKISTQGFDDSVQIRISDTGTGIPEEIRSQIFDPFFTTKEVGKGTGQGLAISYSVIVEKHGGTISFETEMGKGTTFTIKLPNVHP
ncbi:MAG: ATP-binding protein, partial [Thermodesulfobacteriota bacterium]|nr:ATP-binding protein [Thermodesulfobacteriota bacterium]